MTRRSITLLKVAVLFAAMAGLGTGARSASALEQTWPNQCWNQDGGPSCPTCGGGCMHGNYICCNNGGAAAVAEVAN